MITDQLIIKESGQYDKEIIQRLRIERRGLTRISNLDGCTSLMELTLSGNEISLISGLDNLLNLQILDLSFNKIRKIENLSHLLALTTLNLKGNQITNIDDISELQQLPDLSTLHLKGVDGDDANPVSACKHPAYMNVILRTLPNLQIIDGGHLAINDSFQTIESHMESLKADPNSCVTPPLQPWINEKDVALGRKDPTDFEAILNSSKGLSAVNDSLSKIQDILREDCTHLLRKAQTSISKCSTV